MFRSNKAKPTLCLALDGLLATSQPRGGYGPIGEPRPGAAEFTRRLGRSYRIVIHTSRATPDPDPDRPVEQTTDAAVRPVRQWLDDNKIWYDAIWSDAGKPDAALFVGPRELASPADPLPDDLVQLEREIHLRMMSR